MILTFGSSGVLRASIGPKLSPNAPLGVPRPYEGTSQSMCYEPYRIEHRVESSMVCHTKYNFLFNNKTANEHRWEFLFETIVGLEPTIIVLRTVLIAVVLQYTLNVIIGCFTS